MRTRTGVTLAIALTLPLLSACSAPTPAPEPTVAAPASVDGSWVATRTLTDTSVTNEGLEVGLVETRLLEFSDTTCDDAGACTGTAVSAMSDSAEDQAAAIETTFDWDGTSLSLTASSTTDCTFTDGTVAFADAFTIDTSYHMTVGEGDDVSVSSFTGTVESAISTSEEAIATGCPESKGVRTYDVEVVPAG